MEAAARCAPNLNSPIRSEKLRQIDVIRRVDVLKSLPHNKIVSRSRKRTARAKDFPQTSAAETASRSETNSTPIDRLSGHENIPCVFSLLKRGIKRKEV